MLGKRVSSHRSRRSRRPTKFQCAGIKKKDERCHHGIGYGSGPALMERMRNESTRKIFSSIDLFCTQHTKAVLSQSGFFCHKNGEFIRFEDWIPYHLRKEARASLRAEMERPRAQYEAPGYLHISEIDTSNSANVKLKIERIDFLNYPVENLGKFCGSINQTFRGIYPNILESGEVDEISECSHRLLNLVCLELAELASTSVYLDWRQGNGIPHALSVSKTMAQRNLAENRACSRCGKAHENVFEFEKWEESSNFAVEWQIIVKPVIERWGRFVDLYL